MTLERTMELLDKIIVNYHTNNGTKKTIQHLLWLGFTQDELYNYFGFSYIETMNAEDDMGDYED